MPSVRELRAFALSVGGAIALLGVLAFARGRRSVGGTLIMLGGALMTAGLVAPGRLGFVHRTWMGMALAISKITTPLLMGIIYFGVLTPTALVMRLFGHHPLRRSGDATTYWVDRRPDARRSDLRRQF
jgi:hypothetical protein